MMIRNTDQRSKDYGDIAQRYRPGHADVTYDMKYGIRDYRGGGRSSARETAARVAAQGLLARKIVPGLKVRAALISMGDKAIDRTNWDWAEVHKNPFFSPDPQSVPIFEEYLSAIRKEGSSVGAVVIEVVAKGFLKVSARLSIASSTKISSAFMSINAVKGVEIGNGFEAAKLRGEENGDAMRQAADGSIAFQSNHAGGILGGISTGQPVYCSFCDQTHILYSYPQLLLMRQAKKSTVITKGRHH